MIYVDALFDWPADCVENAQARRLTAKYGKWAHMIADTEEELIKFARRLGLRPEWLQKRGTSDAHFDLVPTKHAKALALGAKLLSREEFYEVRRKKRETRGTSIPPKPVTQGTLL